MSKTIVFKTYSDLVSANADYNILTENGVKCFLTDENIVQLYPMFSSPYGGIRLHLMEEDKALATSILEEFYSKQ